MPLVAAAQHTGDTMTFTELQKKYAARQGYTSVRMTSEMLKLYGTIEIAGVNEIRIISADKFSDEFNNDMVKVVRQPQYKLLTVVEEKSTVAHFFFRQTPNGHISRFVMTVWGSETNTIMSISGNFSIAQLQSIATQIKPIKPRTQPVRPRVHPAKPVLQ